MDDDRLEKPDAIIRRNLDAVRSRIRAACQRANRDPADVRLLAVSKTVPANILRVAHAVGLTEFAENRIQEAREKAAQLVDLPVRWSIIGHLQTNKAKYVAGFASEFQAIDSLRIGEELQRRLVTERRTLDVMVQVNTSGNPEQFGLPMGNVADLVAQLAAFRQLRLRGLMTIAAHTTDCGQIRSCFRSLRELRDRLGHPSLVDLSMGMSGDFEIAIEEGATVVRVGSAIFGPRNALLP